MPSNMCASASLHLSIRKNRLCGLDQDHHSLCLTLENRQQLLRTSITFNKYFRVNDRSADENESMADVSLLRAVIMPLTNVVLSPCKTG